MSPRQTTTPRPIRAKVRAATVDRVAAAAGLALLVLLSLVLISGQAGA